MANFTNITSPRPVSSYLVSYEQVIDRNGQYDIIPDPGESFSSVHLDVEIPVPTSEVLSFVATRNSTYTLVPHNSSYISQVDLVVRVPDTIPHATLLRFQQQPYSIPSNDYELSISDIPYVAVSPSDPNPIVTVQPECYSIVLASYKTQCLVIYLHNTSSSDTLRFPVPSYSSESPVYLRHRDFTQDEFGSHYYPYVSFSDGFDSLLTVFNSTEDSSVEPVYISRSVLSILV